MKPVAYGIDFGTTNSSIAVAFDDGSIEMVHVDSRADMPHSLPSIVYLHRNGNRVAGEAAAEEFLVTGSLQTRCANCPLVGMDIEGRWSDCKQFARGGGCHDSRLIAGLKSELANDRFVGTHSWATDFDPPELVAIVLEELKAAAESRFGGGVRRAVLGYPVAFVGAMGDRFDELQDLAEGRLESAAARLGFDHIELFPEPAAVILEQELPDGAAVGVDFGGGTFDVAVLDVQDSEAEVVSLRGAAVGGELFNALLFDHAVADQLGVDQTLSDGRRLPRWIASDLRTLGGVKRLLSNKDLPFALQDFAVRGGDVSKIDELLHGGYAYRFYGAIEEAKIRLSSVTETDLEFRRAGLQVAGRVRRSDLEEMMRPYIDRVMEAVRAALDDAEVRPGEVKTVLRTGGSSQIPMFVDRLKRLFPVAEIQLRPAFTSVAHGLGVIAYEGWNDGR